MHLVPPLSTKALALWAGQCRGPAPQLCPLFQGVDAMRRRVRLFCQPNHLCSAVQNWGGPPAWVQTPGFGVQGLSDL
jgi:hypothetical protein